MFKLILLLLYCNNYFLSCVGTSTDRFSGSLCALISIYEGQPSRSRWGAGCAPQTPSRFEKGPTLLPSARRTLRFEHDGPSAPCDGASTLRLRRENKQLPVVSSGLQLFLLYRQGADWLVMLALLNATRTSQLQRRLFLLFCQLFIARSAIVLSSRLCPVEINLSALISRRSDGW
jgi:hypothetical protein